MSYSYNLPPELIAHEPAEPRDTSRLLVYSSSTDEVMMDTFAHVARYLPMKSALVINNTKVVPARVECTKITGGTVRVLFLINEWDGGQVVHGLPDRKINIGETLYIHEHPFIQAVSQHNEDFAFKLLIKPDEFEAYYKVHGKTPLPPYIHSNLAEPDVRTRYQTIFAQAPAASVSPHSVAAPTASLHFTDQVMSSIAEKGITTIPITLHVGRGTFSPVTDEMLQTGKLHPEPFRIDSESAQAIANAKKNGLKIIASGTTTVRALESSSKQLLQGEGVSGETTLMIKPPYDFKIVDALVTNFHLPNTSLLMLVDAFLQNKKSRKSWRDLYEIAIKQKFHFYSFGDAMLVV